MRSLTRAFFSLLVIGALSACTSPVGPTPGDDCDPDVENCGDPGEPGHIGGNNFGHIGGNN